MTQKLFFPTILLLISNIVFSQTDTTKNKIAVDFGSDLYSRYVWRGTQFGGNSPSLQPGLTAGYKNFEIGAWGAYSLGGNNPSQEMDLHIGYTFINKMFSAVVTDYFFPSENGIYHYFEYDKDKTGHIFESGLSFNGTKKIPISFSAYINFYGGDAAKLGDNPADSTTFNKKTGIQYSNYFELGYNTKSKNTDLTFFLGFTLNNPKKTDINTGFIGETGFYGTGPGIVNLGLTASKTIKITDNYSLPLTLSFITNPQAQRVYLIFGFSF